MSNYIETAFMQQRTDFMKTLPDRRKSFSIPDDVDMYLDIEYVNDQNEAHRLDVFRPSESPDKELPIIFNVHGGGLIMGCKEFNRYFCARLCKLGYVVFSIEYRLVPEYTFYHQCTDFFQALRYVQDYGNLYYGKTDEIYGVGDSGGAMLLMYLCFHALPGIITQIGFFQAFLICTMQYPYALSSAYLLQICCKSTNLLQIYVSPFLGTLS